MNKVLIVVDNTKAYKSVLSTFYNSVRAPEEVILLNVVKLEGRSLMIDMLGEAELSTLRKSLEGTEHKKRLYEKAEKVLDHYRRRLEGGTFRVKTIVREGVPAEEITKAAEAEGAGLILLADEGSRGLERFISGNTSRDLQARSRVPVLVARRASICEEPYTWKDAFDAVSVTGAVIFGLLLLVMLIQAGWLLR